MSFKEGKLDALIRSSEYHSAIVSTYTLDPHYLSTIFTSLIRSKQIKNLIILCDISEYHKVCSNPESFELLKNSKVIVLPAQTSRLFHPKIIFLVGEKAVCSIIGSGNLTYSGMGGNDEIWGAFHVVEGEWKNAGLIKECWDLLSKYLPDITGLGKQLTTDWILNHSKCFKQILEDSNLSNSDQNYELLTNESSDSIWDSIIQRIDGEDVQIVHVVSPYYDSKASILKRIKDELQPTTLNVIFDKHGLLPDRLEYLKGIKFYSWQSIKTETSALHAKILSISMASGRTLNVVGSANATPSGLGIKSQLNNVEAVVLFESRGTSFDQIFGYDLSQFKPVSYHNLPQQEVAVSEPEPQQDAWDHVSIIYAEINGKQLSICFNQIVDHPLTVEIGTNADESVYMPVTDTGIKIIEIDLSATLAKKSFNVQKVKVKDQPYWTVVHSARVLRSNSPDPKFERFNRAFAAIDTNDFSFLVNTLTESLLEEKAHVKKNFSGSSTSSDSEVPDENLQLSKEDFVEKKSKTYELHQLQSEFYLTSIQKLVEKYSSDKTGHSQSNEVNKESIHQNSEDEVDVDDELAERPESMISVSKKSEVVQQRKAYRRFFNRAMKYYMDIKSITALDEFKKDIVQKRVVSYWLLVMHVALARIKEEIVEKIENDERVDFTISPKNRGASLSLEEMNLTMIPKVVGYFRKHKVDIDEILDEDQKLDSVSTVIVLLMLQHYGLKEKKVLRKKVQSVIALFNVNSEERLLLKSKITQYKQSLFPNDTSLQNDWRYQANLTDNLAEISELFLVRK